MRASTRTILPQVGRLFQLGGYPAPNLTESGRGTSSKTTVIGLQGWGEVCSYRGAAGYTQKGKVMNRDKSYTSEDAQGKWDELVRKVVRLSQFYRTGESSTSLNRVDKVEISSEFNLEDSFRSIASLNLSKDSLT